MLEKRYLEGIDNVGLTAEQWRAVKRFCDHNYGNSITGAVLALTCARQGLIDGPKMEEIEESVRREYRAIAETLRELKEKEERKEKEGKEGKEEEGSRITRMNELHELESSANKKGGEAA